MVMKNDEEKMQREIIEFENQRENEMTQNENGCVCVYCVWPQHVGGFGGYFVAFVLIKD